MKSIRFILLVIVLLLLGLSSCSPSINPVVQATPTQTSALTVTDACEQTIVKFLNSDTCKRWDEYHRLFAPDSRHFQSTPMASNDPACDLITANTVLRIMSADEWWQSDNPNQPLSEAAKPTATDEFVFFVEYEIQWAPGVIPAGENPATMLMWMVFDTDNRTCLIRTFGW